MSTPWSASLNMNSPGRQSRISKWPERPATMLPLPTKVEPTCGGKGLRQSRYSLKYLNAADASGCDVLPDLRRLIPPCKSAKSGVLRWHKHISCICVGIGGLRYYIPESHRRAAVWTFVWTLSKLSPTTMGARSVGSFTVWNDAQKTMLCECRQREDWCTGGRYLNGVLIAAKCRSRRSTHLACLALSAFKKTAVSSLSE